MADQSWLNFWYPIKELDIVKRSNIEYKSGLILLLSVLCGLCTVYYSLRLESECSDANVILSFFFFSIPIGMKKFGKWNIFGMAVCIGWMIDNVIIARCSPKEAISLSFYQSLIPSYFILASEEYVFGGFFVSFLLMFSLPYEYSGVIEALEKVPQDELKDFVLSIFDRTQMLNSGHLLAVFGLTMWMHSCSHKEFKLMNKLLEETKQAKQAAEMFFAAFSHEFRSPLNSLLGALTLIKDDISSMTEQCKDLVSTASDCGEVLSNLINNVLDVSKIRAQMFQPSYTKSEPRAIMHKIFNISKTMCFKKGLTLILDIDKNLPKYLMLDGSRLTQVLINLVSNAIKFTAEGYVKIKAIWKFDLNSKGKEFKSEYSNYSCAKPKTWFEKIGDINKESFLSASYSHRFSQNKNFIEAHRKRMPQRSDSIQETNQDDYICEYHDETGGCLIIQIEDTGIGISEENIKKLFNPFVQANQGISKLYGGTGLGLWISKTIMQVYKGDITVSSTVSKGSLFTIQQNCSVSVDKEDHVFVHKGLFSKLHVLLIDSQNTKVNKLALESQGIKVSVCMSAVIAINYLDTLEFSAVFIGLNFLKDDSLTLQNKIKKVQAEKNTLFVIIVIESQAELVPLKYRSYTTIASPINSQDVCKLANSLHKKPKTTYTGTVLILDDDHFILDILSRILEKEKITHITCSKGKQLIEIYNKKYKEISLIVLDANLEDISGFEVAKAVRTFEKTQELAEVPIICVSGDYDKDHLKKCSEAQITLTCKL